MPVYCADNVDFCISWTGGIRLTGIDTLITNELCICLQNCLQMSFAFVYKRNFRDCKHPEVWLGVGGLGKVRLTITLYIRAGNDAREMPGRGPGELEEEEEEVSKWAPTSILYVQLCVSVRFQG